MCGIFICVCVLCTHTYVSRWVCTLQQICLSSEFLSMSLFLPFLSVMGIHRPGSNNRQLKHPHLYNVTDTLPYHSETQTFLEGYSYLTGCGNSVENSVGNAKVNKLYPAQPPGTPVCPFLLQDLHTRQVLPAAPHRSLLCTIHTGRYPDEMRRKSPEMTVISLPTVSMDMFPPHPPDIKFTGGSSSCTDLFQALRLLGEVRMEMGLSTHGFLGNRAEQAARRLSEEPRASAGGLERPGCCPTAHPKLMKSCQRSLTWYRCGPEAQRASCLEKPYVTQPAWQVQAR